MTPSPVAAGRSFAPPAPGRGGLRRVCSAAAIVLSAACAGCATLGVATSQPAADDMDIMAATSFFEQDPWLRDTDGRAIGIRARTYFTSRESNKGRFVPGDIEVVVNALSARRGGALQREPLHSWRLDAEQAAPFRLRKRSLMGDSYGLVLRWPDDLDIYGRRVEFVIGYHRSDQRFVQSPSRQLVVPQPVVYAPSAPRPPTGAASPPRAARTDAQAPQPRAAPSPAPPTGDGPPRIKILRSGKRPPASQPASDAEKPEKR